MKKQQNQTSLIKEEGIKLFREIAEKREQQKPFYCIPEWVIEFRKKKWWQDQFLIKN